MKYTFRDCSRCHKGFVVTICVGLFFAEDSLLEMEWLWWQESPYLPFFTGVCFLNVSQLDFLQQDSSECTHSLVKTLDGGTLYLGNKHEVQFIRVHQVWPDCKIRICALPCLLSGWIKEEGCYG